MMHSKASSGRSRTERDPSVSSTFSTLEDKEILLKDILVMLMLLLMSPETGKKERSFQNQGDNNLVSDIHCGRGLRERDLRKIKKGKQVMKK